jgi:hypothetical protein
MHPTIRYPPKLFLRGPVPWRSPGKKSVISALKKEPNN